MRTLCGIVWLSLLFAALAYCFNSDPTISRCESEWPAESSFDIAITPASFAAPMVADAPVVTVDRDGSLYLHGELRTTGEM